MSEFGCSRLDIDPSFPDFYLASYMQVFKDFNMSIVYE